MVEPCPGGLDQAPPPETLDRDQLLARLQAAEQRLERVDKLDLEGVARAAYQAVTNAGDDLDVVREGYWAVFDADFSELDEALEAWRADRRRRAA